MDATQMMNDSVLESDEEENNDREDALGKLCILKNQHIPEKECPLYLGENIFGRDPNTCSVLLLAPSVSKQHATISLSVYRRKGGGNEVEALLWDMGSMNGTRKGHIKLTPNVRYALSEGESFVVADITCKYTKCTTDCTRTPVTPNLKTRDVFKENGGNLHTSNTKCPVTATKMDGLADAEGTQGTPARTSGLSSEQTPTQPQSFLVPDSESESEEDKSGDRRRKAKVSDSDSHQSSPICSTFMSPSNKVVPESEDESPITPSSSYKNRTHHVSFNMESDSDNNRQKRKKTEALDIVDDSEEETGNDNSSVQPKLSKVASNATLQADTVSKINMDSDTDVEEEEEKQTVTSATVMSSNAQATEQQDFHMDSDTDVEDEDNNEPEISDHVILSNDIPKTAPVLQPKEITIDSDTDVEEEEKPSTAAAPETSTNVQVSPNAAGFNIDSETDVEDEDLVSAAKEIKLQSTNVEMPKTSANPSDFKLDSDTDVDEGESDITPGTPSRLDVKSPTLKPATPLGVPFDSDTGGKGIFNVPVNSKPPEDLEILSNSDTDVEDDSPDVKPTTSGLVVAECEVESAGTGVNKSVVSSSTKDKPAALSVDSDTDVEDNEVDIRETEDNKMPILQRETTPGIQDVLLKNCSTPIQQQAGNLEEMETQAFLSPSISAYRRAVAPQRSDALSSCSSQEDDYVVAETQSFILSDRAPDPNKSLGSSMKDVSNSSGVNFQLELSDSSVLQCQAQALAMESTQAFINANLEETQPYADAVITEKKNTTVDIALQATQAYFDLQDTDKEAENSEGGGEGEEEATQPLEILSVAPTQPMCVDDNSDGEDSAPVFRQKKAKQIEEEENQRFSDVAPTQPMEIQDSETDENPVEIEAETQDLTVAQTVNIEILEDTESESADFRKDVTKSQENETQQNSDLIVAQTVPMEIPEGRENDEDSTVMRKKGSKSPEEQMQQNSDLIVAQTMPMEMPEECESDEDSTLMRKKGSKTQEEETQQNSDLIVPQTVSIEMPEDTEESNDNGPVFSVGTAKQLRSEEEATQSIAASKSEGTDDEDSGPMFKKRKVKCIARIEDTQPSLESEITENPAEPIPAPVEDSIPVGEQRTQPAVLSDDGESDEEDAIPAPRKRKARKLEDTQSLISQFDTKDGGEASNVGLKASRGGTRLVKEKQEEVAEPTKRQTRGKSKVEQVSKGRRRRTKVESEEESQEEEEGENKMAAKILKEKNEKEMMECQNREKEEKERLEKEQKEEIERLEKQKEQEEKERRANLQNVKLEKERIKQEKKELAAKLKKEKEEKKQENLKEMQRLEREKREQEEKQRAEDEQKELAEKAKLDAAKKQEIELQTQQEEKERLEKDETKVEAQAQRRGRRTGRRTTAIPDSSTVADKDDVPAKRTRSRSNSSNSVCSERSVSSSVSQTSRGRGRGRGARKMEVEKTPSRGRRRTVAVTEVSTPSPPTMLSRSNSNTSLNSEFSVSSVSSQGRGRGGRQRGRGRKTGIECANDQVSNQKATQRGRKSARICPEDEEDKGDNTQSSLSTRGKRGAKDPSTKCTPEDEEGTATASTSSAERKGGRAKQVVTKNDLEKKSLEVEENDEAKHASFNGKRKAAARNTPARKSMKVTEDNTKSDKPKGKGRASTVQAKNCEEQGDSGSSANSMEREEPPQTPRSSVSRKRSPGDSESDTLAKTPRSSTVSPSTGRSRTASQTYKVLFTGVVDEAGEKVLTRLGGEMAKDVSNMNCLVTDKVRRTVKFLCAVAKGIPIVTTQWLEKSGKAGTFLSPHSYLVKDREQENKFNFNLQESLRVASSQPLLQGYEIHVTKSVKPEPVHMKDIISCSGAVFLPKMPSSNKPNTVVISCEEDWSLCAPALSRGLPVVSSEFILTGILQQKLDLEIHKLSGPVSAPTAGRGRGRKKT